MARPYSLDLRDRVVSAVAEGMSCRAAARRFGVSAASAVKWCQRQRRTGSAAASRMGGRRPYALAAERDWLLARIAEKPDLTLRALAAELAERGVKVSYFAVWHFFDHEGMTFKKKACTRPSRTGRTWSGNASAGDDGRRGLILRDWCSSTRPGPRPT